MVIPCLDLEAPLLTLYAHVVKFLKAHWLKCKTEVSLLQCTAHCTPYIVANRHHVVANPDPTLSFGINPDRGSGSRSYTLQQGLDSNWQILSVHLWACSKTFKAILSFSTEICIKMTTTCIKFKYKYVKNIKIIEVKQVSDPDRQILNTDPESRSNKIIRIRPGSESVRYPVHWQCTVAQQAQGGSKNRLCPTCGQNLKIVWKKKNVFRK